MDDDATEIAFQVISVLESLKIRYVVGGSLASSVHGVARTTIDVDLIAELTIEQVKSFVSMLEKDFYVDESAVREAINSRSSFNLIHFDSSFKVDIFIPKRRAFDELQLKNGVPSLLDPQRNRLVYLLSPEDTVLAKLDWYKMGNKLSDRQWQDILGVMCINRGKLDLDYMAKCAKALNVVDLLEKALDESKD